MACQCLRVDQLDANVLDNEIRVLTQDSVAEVIHELPIKVSRFCEKIGPEIKLTLDAIIWSHRYFRGASVGQELMDIAYRNYPSKTVFSHFFVSAFLPYISRRLAELRPDLSKIQSKIEAIYELLELCHFLLFLRGGGTSTIPETILSLRNWNNNQPQIGQINYDTQNRELLWHTFRDALLLLWPIAKLSREKLIERQKSRNAPKFEHTFASNLMPNCSHCSKPPVIPMIGATCHHVMCYYCSFSVDHVCTICCDVEDEKTKMIFMNQFLVKNDEKNENL